MTRRRSAARGLRVIERALLALGAALAVWSGTVWLRARWVARLPVPPPALAASVTTATGEPPGEGTPHSALAPGAWLGRLEAPSVGLSATVLEGSDDGTLSLGAGHVEGTAWPGGSGNVGIAGHRDTTFREVRHLHAGDPLVLTTADWEFRYRVRTLTIVEPADVYVLDPIDHPTLTLVTCYPFTFIGHAPRRFIVSADLVGKERRETGRSAALTAPRERVAQLRSQHLR